eukprot:13092817-Heterocapsa_arctica.AAC.1
MRRRRKRRGVISWQFLWMVPSACHVSGKVCMPGTNGTHFVSGCTHGRKRTLDCYFLGTTEKDSIVHQTHGRTSTPQGCRH